MNYEMDYRNNWIESKNKFIETIKKEFNSELNYIIVQDYEDSKVIANWSDLDFFLVFNSITFDVENRVSSIKTGIESQYNIHIGSTLLSTKEFDYPISNYCPLKINLMKLGLCYSGTIIKPHRLIHGKKEKFNFSVEEVNTDTFLKEISLFQSNFRNIIRDKAKTSTQELIRPIIKTTKYIILCALLNESIKDINNYVSIYEAARFIFKDFNDEFEILAEIEDKKPNIKNETVDIQFIDKSVNFLEKFISYYLEKCISRQV